MSALRVVPDARIVFAAFKLGRGASARLLSCSLDGVISLLALELLWAEYADALGRSTGVLNCDGATVERFLSVLVGLVTLREVYSLWRPHLRDVADDKVLGCAVAAWADFLVVFKGRDCKGNDQFGLRVVTPAQLLAYLVSMELESALAR